MKFEEDRVVFLFVFFFFWLKRYELLLPGKVYNLCALLLVLIICNCFSLYLMGALGVKFMKINNTVLIYNFEKFHSPLLISPHTISTLALLLCSIIFTYVKSFFLSNGFVIFFELQEMKVILFN